MEIIEKEIEGLLEIIPDKFLDKRGSFFESFNQKRYDFITMTLVQQNVSVSKKNTVRGLHFQLPPHSQGKLVQVIYGKILDIALDLRKKSPTYGKHVKVFLDSEKNNQLWIPSGFAHGFLSLSDNTILQYNCSEYFNKLSERTILWNDPTLKIDWGIIEPIISNKDQEGERFLNFESPF